MLSYLLILFLLIYSISVLFKRPGLLRLIYIPAVLALLLASVIAFADAEMFRAWGSKFNSQARQYLIHPSEAMASASEAYWFTIVIITAALLFLGLWSLKRIIRPYLSGVYATKRVVALPAMLAALAFAPLIRGGLQTIPISQSAVYFSRVPFENLAAVNSTWNMMYYWVNELPEINPEDYHYQSFEAVNVAAMFRDTVSTAMPESMRGANVVLVILESFSSYTSKYFGGEFDATPHLDAMAAQGWSFTRAYAQGDRTDKGLAAILGGWPGLPNRSILFEPSKSAKLHSLAALAAVKNYSTAFYYGGDMAFANMAAYVRNAGFRSVTDESAFSQKQKGSKWGVHDEFIFQRFLQDADTLKKPFFTAILTLSSHEPYDVPGSAGKKLQSENERFLNAVSYTDQCIKNFMDMASGRSWYKNTVFVFVADHGRNLGLPDMAFNQPKHFRVPILFFGEPLGALSGVADSGYCNQTDIAETLAGRVFGAGTDYFPYGRDLSSKNHEFSFYSFNDGFGILSKKGHMVWGNNPAGVIEHKGDTTALLLQGQAIQYDLVKKYRFF